MDLEEADQWANSPSGNELRKDLSTRRSSLSNFDSRQLEQQKWDDSSILDYDIGIEVFQEFNQPSKAQDATIPLNPNDQAKILGQGDVQMLEAVRTDKISDWDARTMLNNLSFLEEKIHQLQDLVHFIVGRRSQVLGRPDDLMARQQQLVTADITSIIAQLISAAGSLLPSVKRTISDTTPSAGQLLQPGGVDLAPLLGMNGGVQPQNNSRSEIPDELKKTDLTANYGGEQNNNFDEHDKDEEDVDEGENLPPGTYEILQLEKEEILAPHTHFCAICGKGFKRDANLRMHMRGHGDEYKTAAALAKPNKESCSEPMVVKRYSCPFAGCKRNRDHKKFQPLKTILCVKNHYKRTHCDKSYTCSRCHTKKFSVIADLKTHEKHCGKDKWLCSCGTTFSRKDKLFGHIALFQGHTPAIPLDETKGNAVPADHAKGMEVANNNSVSSANFNFPSAPAGATSTQNIVGVKGSLDDPTAYFSPMNFETCNFGGFHEFPRPPFEDSESSLSFLLSGSCNYAQKTGCDSNSNTLE